MPVGKTELLKRSLVKGTSFIDMTRERAEVLVKELVEAGVVRKGQAEKAIDVVVERSRKRSEALGNLIRHEVAEQLSAFGVATRDDIARLEAKLGGSASAPGGTASRVKASHGAKEAPITKSATARKTTKGPRQPAATPAMKPDGRSPGAGPESSGAR